ncbi:hypothetical protein DEQ92_20585 [Haloferax sp. Atlit-6N]|uniref:sulfatase n=1 Tax=Haloferax sp. Atlit-6N TaxID=2077205 RepID=UPI000E267E5A|nr:sulfatase [Haloferax sp. Atlit-6N]REA00137.1 hypothetical protein DEQ92_20585 [Haloferax sp. Atlit-6N]
MNILVYVIDCLRADHVSCYGYQRETTPNIDALAADGIRYEQCFSPATWTRPVSASILTGLYPPAHGVRHREDTFSKGLPRLPRSLKQSGFETVGVSTMGNVSSALGYDVGFDQFFDLYKEDEIIRKRTNTSTNKQRLWHENQDKIALPKAEDINDYLLPSINSSGEDLFSFAWSIDPHMPLNSSPQYTEFVNSAYDGPIDGTHESIPDELTEADLNHLRGLYDSEVRYTDEQFGLVIDELKRQGEYDESLIIVLGDHGEAFGEHGQFFHGNRPHDEVIHVPLIIKPPRGTVSTNSSVDTPVSLIDIFPTVNHIVDGEPLPERVQGKVLPPYQPTDEDRPIFSETEVRDIEPAFRSVRTSQWKYIDIQYPSLRHVIEQMYRQRDMLPSTRYALSVIRDVLYSKLSRFDEELLYQIDDDAGERNNVATDYPAALERVQTTLEEWLTDCQLIYDQNASDDNHHIDDATAEQLRQLGYTD